MAIVLEQLTRGGQVLSHETIEKSSFVLGRAFACTKRINDPYISEQHLKVELDESGQIHIQDLDSLNGLKVNGKSVYAAQVTAEDEITIGRSRIRIFSMHEAVPPALKLNPLEEKLDWLSRKRIVMMLALVLVAFTGLEVYLTTFREIRASMLMSTFFSLLLVSCVIPLGFALLAILNKREARIFTQISIVLLACIFLILVAAFIRILSINLQMAGALNILSLVLTWATYITAFWLAMYVAFQQSNVKRNSIVLSVCVIIALGMYLPKYIDKRDYIGKPDFVSGVASPIFLLKTPNSTDIFINDANSLFEDIKAEQQP